MRRLELFGGSKGYANRNHHLHYVGPFGVTKTETSVKQNYYISGLKDKVTNVLHNCVPCILANKKQGK